MRKYRTAKIIIGLLIMINGAVGLLMEFNEPSGVQIGAHKIILIILALEILLGYLIIVGKSGLKR